MDARTMNRRRLCKMIVALMLVGIASPLKKLSAEERVPMPDARLLAKGKQQNKPEGLVCILRRRSSGNCVTFLSEPDTAKQSAGKDNVSGKGWLD